MPTNPRGGISHRGVEPKRQLPWVIDEVTITFDKTAIGGSAQVGLAVTVSAVGKVIELAGDGDPVLGELMLVEADDHGNHKATVRSMGTVELPRGASATITAGSKIVGAEGAGGALGHVRSVAPAVAAELAAGRGMVTDWAGTSTGDLVSVEL